MARNFSRFRQVFRSTCTNVKREILKHNELCFIPGRQYTSALYVSGRKHEKNVNYVVPYLDYDHKFENMEKFEKDLKLRGVNANTKKIWEMWNFYKEVRTKKQKIEKTSAELVSKMSKFYKIKDLTPEQREEFSKLEIQYLVVKEDFKLIRSILWDLDDSFIAKLLKLPNGIDERTPLKFPSVLKEFGTLHNLPDGETKSHIEIGKRLGLLEYKNPMQCYLCNDAAFFELGVLSFAGKVLRADDMIRVSGSDFSRSLLVEGSGLNHENPWDAFVIDNHTDVEKDSPNRMHLVGGASLISFLALHVKQLINPKHFPVKYFSTGRQYTPFPAGSTPIGLFTVCQTSAVHVFTMVKEANSEEYNVEFEKLLNTICKLYESICDHYRVIMRPVSELRPWEGMRVSFELWSQFTKQYIEVGHISVCGDYFSKRLLITYQTSTGRSFPSVISGTVLSVPRLLGCLLEQNPENFVIPPKIAAHMPVDNVL